MIKQGNTIVYLTEEGVSFFWLCIVEDEHLVFFDWYGNPRKATSTDYWRISKGWFDEKVNEGVIEVYDSFPMEKYGDVFVRNAIDDWKKQSVENER